MRRGTYGESSISYDLPRSPPISPHIPPTAGRRRELAEYDGCSLGCPDEWVGDDVCDEACNNEACSYDAADCFREAGECYTLGDGADYRGKVAVTTGGRQCQAWSAQVPNHHTMSTNNFPDAGLGGHNYCRNPDVCAAVSTPAPLASDAALPPGCLRSCH